jgi:hypothetical protein
MIKIHEVYYPSFATASRKLDVTIGKLKYRCNNATFPDWIRHERICKKDTISVEEIRRINARKWHEKHTDEYLEYLRERTATDPKYNAMKVFKTIFYSVVNHGSKKNKTKIEGYLGCTLEEFREHIESSFSDKSWSWENYGRSIKEGKKWCFAHLMPVSYCDHTSERELKKFWNYKNIKADCILHNQAVSSNFDLD